MNPSERRATMRFELRDAEKSLTDQFRNYPKIQDQERTLDHSWRLLKRGKVERSAQLRLDAWESLKRQLPESKPRIEPVMVASREMVRLSIAHEFDEAWNWAAIINAYLENHFPEMDRRDFQTTLGLLALYEAEVLRAQT